MGIRASGATFLQPLLAAWSHGENELQSRGSGRSISLPCNSTDKLLRHLKKRVADRKAAQEGKSCQVISDCAFRFLYLATFYLVACTPHAPDGLVSFHLPHKVLLPCRRHSPRPPRAPIPKPSPPSRPPLHVIAISAPVLRRDALCAERRDEMTFAAAGTTGPCTRVEAVSLSCRNRSC